MQLSRIKTSISLHNFFTFLLPLISPFSIFDRRCPLTDVMLKFKLRDYHDKIGAFTSYALFFTIGTAIVSL